MIVWLNGWVVPLQRRTPNVWHQLALDDTNCLDVFMNTQLNFNRQRRRRSQPHLSTCS